MSFPYYVSQHVGWYYPNVQVLFRQSYCWGVAGIASPSFLGNTLAEDFLALWLLTLFPPPLL